MNAGLLADPAYVRTLLTQAAAARRALTYSELLNDLGHAFTRPKMRALCKVLASIDEETAERAEPELAVLVVRQSDGLPGQGWWVSSAIKHGHDGAWTGPEAARLIERLQNEAFEYWANRLDGAQTG